MKIGFIPQTLVRNLATETFSNNGNTLNRIIEIPATATKPERVLDITYKKGEFIPTQWYVANYNLFSRNGKKVVNKTLVNQKAHPDEIHSVITTYGTNGYAKEVTIDVSNGEVSKTAKTISK